MDDVTGRAPVAVMVADSNVPNMFESARFARAAGTDWLIVHSPAPLHRVLIRTGFFGAVADSVDCPFSILNAPEFLTIDPTSDELFRLNATHQNVTVLKAVANGKKVFNGRAGLELYDNYLAGADRMITSVELINFQVAIERAMLAGNDTKAIANYRRILLYLSFSMQG